VEGETKKLLITKIKRADASRADLFAKGHKFRDIICFDISELVDAGVDYQNLPVGQEVPCRFWAYYQESENKTANGNPYLDLVAVEPFGEQPAKGGVDLDQERLFTALRVIYQELVAIRQHLVGEPAVKPAPAPEPDPEPAAPPAPEPAPAPPAPLSEEEAKRRFWKQAGEAIRSGELLADLVNQIADEVKIGKKSWRDALVELG